MRRHSSSSWAEFRDVAGAGRRGNRDQRVDDKEKGVTRIRASTLFFDQALDRFFSTLPWLHRSRSHEHRRRGAVCRARHGDARVGDRKPAGG